MTSTYTREKDTMGNEAYILTIDQGTSSTKIILYDGEGRKKAEATHFIRLIESDNNFIEQNPEDILVSIQNGMKDVIDKTGINPKAIRAVAMDNQGETIIPFRKSDMMPLYNAVSWQDGRGETRIEQLRRDSDFKSYIKEKTGLLLSSYFSAAKMEWLVQNISRIKKEMNNDNLMLATSEVWLINKLTSKKLFKSDFTTASRTMLFDIELLQWDERILDTFHLKLNCLPDIVPTMYNYGITDPGLCYGIEAPVLVSIVDQQSAMVGHRCFKEGEAKLTLGTGGFLQINCGVDSKNKSNVIIKSLFPQMFDNISYIYEGQIYSVGSAIEWLKRNTFFSYYSDIDSVDQKYTNTLPFFIPALSGISAPYWKSEPFAAFLGMSLQTTKSDLLLSVLEAIGFRIVQNVKLIQEETNIEIKTLSVDGRVSRSQYILKTISALTGKKIIRYENEDLTSLGCFFLASLQMGINSSYDELLDYTLNAEIITEPSDPLVAERFSKWESLLRAVVAM